MNGVNCLNSFDNNTIGDSLNFRVVVEQDEAGVFVATVPSLPGCISQGKTRAQALINIKDAIKGYLDSLKKHHEPIPPTITEDVVEVYA